jgi:hypothetical protein
MMHEAVNPMRVSIPKLRRARFKDGCQLTVIDTRADLAYQGTRDAMRDAIAETHRMENIAGFALVAWSACGHVNYRNVYNSEVSPLRRMEIAPFAFHKLRDFCLTD